MSRLSEKIIMALLGLFLIAYVAYQVYGSFYGSMKTESALEYTVSRAVPVQGIIARSETVIEGNYAGVENNLFDNGVRVTVGENIAEFYESENSNRNLKRLRKLESEIATLKEAQDTSVVNFSATDGINRDIKEQLGLLSRLSNTGKYESSEALRQNLTFLINKKQIATGVASDFEIRINELESESEGLDKDSGHSTTVFAKAPVSGYFCKSVDGYENWFNIKSTEEFGINDYFTVIDGDSPAEFQNPVGKIVTNQNWIFAAAASRSSLEFARPGQEVILYFDTLNQNIPATITKIMQEKDNERAVILLSCNTVSGDLLEIRRANATINFSRHTGLRVNMSAIRFVDNKRGVYILDRNNTVRFKELDPIYEEQGFVLTRLLQPDSSETEYVRQFDMIITKGTDLYDGKVIQ